MKNIFKNAGKKAGIAGALALLFIIIAFVVRNNLSFTQIVISGAVAVFVVVYLIINNNENAVDKAAEKMVDAANKVKNKL